MSEKVRRRRLGFQRERELARKFWSLGFACMRAPASGAKTKRTLYPDLIVIKEGKVFVMEVKTRERRGIVYIPDEQMRRLLEFARRAGAMPLVAIKFMDGSSWRFVRADTIGHTRAGTWKVTLEDYEKGYTIEDIVKLTRSEVKLTRFLKAE